MNKRADLAVTLLVLMTLVLTGASLFIFNSNTGKVKIEITDARFLDEIYLVENEINFYIQDMIENSIEKDITEEKFIQKFQIELEKHKDKKGKYIIEELSQVKEKINENRLDVVIENNEVLINNLNIRIIRKFEDKLDVTYVSNKQFKEKIV
tara:strand:- start:612 stop:1067 length:456 start_codon:yes stop_codon:yes gene_type:complete